VRARHTNTRFRVLAGSTQTDVYARLLLDVRNQGAQYSWNIVARTRRVGEVQISLALFVFAHSSAAWVIQKSSLPHISEITTRQACREHEHLNSGDVLPRHRRRVDVARAKEF